jgi:uroporphyrinogen decarboxylase
VCCTGTFATVPALNTVMTLIADPIRSMDQISRLRPLDDPSSSLPFIRETLKTLRSEIDDETTLLGFVGTPWTLAAYAMEGKAERHCFNTKVN